MAGPACKGFLIFSVLSACSASPEHTSAPGPNENQVVFDGVRIDRYEQDRLRNRARLARARLDRASGRIMGVSVSADVLGDGVESRVEAPSLTSDLRSRVVVLSGGVEITDRDGRVLQAETVRYDTGKDEIETSAPVRIEGENFQATGGRLTGRPRAGQLEVAGPATGTVTPSSRDRR